MANRYFISRRGLFAGQMATQLWPDNDARFLRWVARYNSDHSATNRPPDRHSTSVIVPRWPPVAFQMLVPSEWPEKPLLTSPLRPSRPGLSQVQHARRGTARWWRDHGDGRANSDEERAIAWRAIMFSDSWCCRRQAKAYVREASLSASLTALAFTWRVLPTLFYLRQCSVMLLPLKRSIFRAAGDQCSYRGNIEINTATSILRVNLCCTRFHRGIRIFAQLFLADRNGLLRSFL